MMGASSQAMNPFMDTPPGTGAEEDSIPIDKID
jgi:hypothetical protein